MSNNKLMELDQDPLAYLDEEGVAMMATEGVSLQTEDEEDLVSTLDNYETLTGCFSIVGPVAICFNRVGSGFKICLKLAGIDAACANVGVDRCQTLSANVLLAKASVRVCFQNRCLTYDAKACVRPTPFSKWKCYSKKGKLICV
jgi:hypothetical protein